MRTLFLAAAFAAAAHAQPLAPQPDTVLNGARSWALQYARTLPDFFCTQYMRRFVIYTGQQEVRLDTLTVQVGFSQRKEAYRLLARNNRPSHQTLASLNGAMSTGEFGSALFLIFDPDSAAIFQPGPAERIRRRPVAVYSYAVPQVRSRYKLLYGTEETITAYHGRVYIDAASGRVLRLTMSVDPRGDFPIRETNTVLDYDYRDIGGALYLLPVHADVRTTEHAREYHGDLRGRPVYQFSKYPLRYHTVVEFRDYHKYAIDSKIGFDPQ